MYTDKIEYFNGFLNTNPLWNGNEFDIDQFEIPEIDLSNFIPSTIPKNIRLGHQIEHVFLQLIKHSNSYNILIQNLPIRNTDRTLGEIDFILEEIATGQLIHVELTYKFYIIDADIVEPIHQLIGTNRKDSFFSKIEKIKKVQFPLLYSTQGLEALKAQNIDTKNIVHKTCFKGQLFTPYSKSIETTPLNKLCVVGYWLHYHQFSNDVFKFYTYYIPVKKDWLLEPHENVSWKNHTNTAIALNNYLLSNQSPMVWLKKSKSTFEKFFVVWW